MTLSQKITRLQYKGILTGIETAINLYDSPTKPIEDYFLFCSMENLRALYFTMQKKLVLKSDKKLTLRLNHNDIVALHCMMQAPFNHYFELSELLLMDEIQNTARKKMNELNFIKIARQYS